MMNQTIAFNIRLEKPCSSEDYLPPDDPLGELSSLEIGLRRFCYQYNHRIVVDIGRERRHLFLFPDICLLIESLPEKIAELSLGKSVELAFPESWLTIYLSPIDEIVLGTLEEYGEKVINRHFELNLAQLVSVLKGFTQQIVQAALNGRYITQEEAAEFLSQAPAADEFTNHVIFSASAASLPFYGQMGKVVPQPALAGPI